MGWCLACLLGVMTTAFGAELALKEADLWRGGLAGVYAFLSSRLQLPSALRCPTNAQKVKELSHYPNPHAPGSDAGVGVPSVHCSPDSV